MRIPVEILAQIVEYVDLLGDLEDTLALRLTSRVVNREVLRALLRSDELHPSNTDKLLEINRVEIQTHIKTHELVRYRERHAATDEDGLPRRVRTCFIGHPRVQQEILPATLPLLLLRPYLEARMDRAAEDPCLFSIFVDRSVDLIMEGRTDHSNLERQRLFQQMVSRLSINLISTQFVKKIFGTLFNSSGLHYWLPLYDTAHLSTYPEPSHNIRLFYFFRIAYISAQARDQAVKEQLGTIVNILADPPATPEYARLFAIDCFNLAVKSKNDQILDTFLNSETGKLLGTLTLSERVWCMTKQGKQDLGVALLSKALCSNDADSLATIAYLVVEGLVEAGEETHFGRTVVDELLKCKDIREVKELCRDMDLEDISQIHHRISVAEI